MRVGVVGMGWVGSSVAISTLHAGVARELLVNDVDGGLAEGEAMDLAHGASFYPAASVRAASLAEMRDADAIVIAAGHGGRADQSRLALLRENASIGRAIGSELRGARGVIVVVTNPVDVMTHVVRAATGLPAGRVLGTGTMLDSARLRHAIGRELGIDPRSVHAHVVGEHGDSEVVLWSAARVGATPLRALRGWDRAREGVIAAEVRTAAYEVIRRKGATNHAIGLVTARLLSSIVRDEGSVYTVSRAQEAGSAAGDVTLSLPAVVGAAGALRVVEPELDEQERHALVRSADLLRAAIASAR